MWIYERLGLNTDNKEVIAFVGGGGKTTTIFQLGRELKKLNKKVLITTTTAIFNPEEGEYDCFFLEDIKEDFIPSNGTITIFGEEIKNGKLLGSPLLKMEEIIKNNVFDFILIEADGAKGKPIKAPAIHEPVVPKNTTKTIGVIGLDCLGKRIDEETVHRTEIFMKVTDTSYSDIIDEDTIINLVLDNEGLFKGTQGEKTLLLNKAYNEKTILQGSRIRRMLLEKGFKNTIVSDIRRKKFY